MRGKAGPLPRFSGLFFSDWPVFLQPVAKNSPEKGEQGLPCFARLPLLPPSQDCFFRPVVLAENGKANQQETPVRLPLQGGSLETTRVIPFMNTNNTIRLCVVKTPAF